MRSVLALVRFVWALLLMALMMLTISGCWDRREPETLLFPSLIAFDIDEDDQYEVLAQFPNPSISGGSGNQGVGSGGQAVAFWLNSGKGSTPFDALKNLALTCSRQVTLTHVGVVLISEKLARRGIGPVLELFLRNYELRLTTRVAIVEGSLRDLLESEIPLEPTPGRGIRRMLDFVRAEKSEIPEGNLLEKMREISHPGHNPLFMRITVLPAAKEQTYVDPGSTQNKVPQPIVKIHGSAVFDGDKMVDWMDDIETMGANWVLDTIVRAVAVVDAPDGKGIVTIELKQTRSESKPVISGDRIRIETKIGAVARVQDVTTSTLGNLPLGFDEHATLQWLTDETAESIERAIDQALKKAKELGVDIFGFGNMIYRKQPRIWDEIVQGRWDEVFRTLEVDVQVEVFIRRPGLATSALTPR